MGNVPTDEKQGCSVCGYSVVLHGDLCSKCEDQKRQMEELKRQKKRDQAFGSPWDFARERGWK